MVMKVSKKDVEAIFEAWKKRRDRPHLCRLTVDRADLIKKRLRLGYEGFDFLLLIDSAWESEDDGPRWWRGNNPTRKKYLTIDALLRREKLASRIEAALIWHEDGRGANSRPDSEEYFGMRLVGGGS